MGYITEPRGVDFIIDSPPLTEVEKTELSEFIEKQKARTKKKSQPKKGSISEVKNQPLTT